MSLSPRDRLRRLASYYEDQVGHSRADQIAAKAMLRARPLVRRHTAWIAATSIAAAIGGLIGVGAISDEAHPGQILYPLDRAYESVAAFVGVDTGPSEERLVEALALLDLGRDLDAIRLVDEALVTIGRDAGVDDWAAAAPAAPAVASPAKPPVTGDGIEPAAATEETVSETTVVAAEAPDSASSLRLATEYLLQTVRDAKKPKDGVPSDDTVINLRAAASGVVAASESIKAQAALTAAAEDASTTTVPGGSTTTTTVPNGSTTTTVPGGSTTTTTVPGGSTTTTVPGGSTTTTTVTGGSTTTTVPGPIIILPPQP